MQALRGTYRFFTSLPHRITHVRYRIFRIKEIFRR
jgi:hypothetical protein